MVKKIKLKKLIINPINPNTNWAIANNTEDPKMFEVREVLHRLGFKWHSGQPINEYPPKINMGYLCYDRLKDDGITFTFDNEKPPYDVMEIDVLITATEFLQIYDI